MQSSIFRNVETETRPIRSKMRLDCLETEAFKTVTASNFKQSESGLQFILVTEIESIMNGEQEFHVTLHMR